MSNGRGMMGSRQLRRWPAELAAQLLLCAFVVVVYRASAFCPDPQATNYHPDALQEHAPDCEYSCSELAFFFKANAALDPTSVPECTYVTVDQVEACVETATGPSVPADRVACSQVLLGTASSASDCAAVRLAADPGTSACTHVVPDPTAQVVVSGEDRVIIGTPTFNLMARRLEVAGPRANAALRYIRMRELTDAGSGGGAIAVQSGGVAVFDCIFEGNIATMDGGAIVGRDSIVAVERTLFVRNAATRGGAIALIDSKLRTDESTFQLNMATEHGGAVHVAQGSASAEVVVSISYTHFADNAADAACPLIGSTNAGDACNADSRCRYNAADDVCETTSSSYTGDAVYLTGVSRWSAVNATYIPYDSLRTVETQGVPMVSCDDSAYMSCQLGQACSYGMTTLYCSPCQPNLASDDGFQCELCPPGRGPSVKQDACLKCAAGLYSSHGICVQCGRGKQPNTEQSACDNCLSGTYSDNGIRCEMCPAGTEPHSLIGSDEDAGWENWAETDPRSLIGAADCILCHGGRYKPQGILDSCTSTLVATVGTVTAADTTLCSLTPTPDYGVTPGTCENVGPTATCEYVAAQYEEACTECDGGYQPTTNHSLCEECPSGKAGLNGTCETCPDGYRPNALPQSCTEGNTILNSPVECVGMTGDVCEYTCNAGYSVGGTHRCGLQAFEGGFCHPNDCIEGNELDHSETVCAGFLGDECLYECDEGYSVTGHHVCGKNRAFTGGSCTPNPCTNGTSIPHSPTTCTSRTGDDCAFVCDRGYFATGTHTCGADGVLRGGECMPSSCSEGVNIDKSPTTCTGTTGYNCQYSCNPGYAVGQPHLCGPDNWFRGGSCIPKRCITGVRLPNSPTLCNGTTGDVCQYSCDPGYTPVGVHTCTVSQFFAGGRCQ